jgi:hypothetical protein
MLHHSAVGSAMRARLAEDTMVAVAVLTGIAALGLFLVYLHRDDEKTRNDRHRNTIRKGKP